MTLAILLVAIANILLGCIAVWQRAHAGKRELARMETLLADEKARIDHLLSLLAKREAPAEEAWWMDENAPHEPLIPANAVWADDGLSYWVPEEED